MSRNCSSVSIGVKCINNKNYFGKKNYVKIPSIHQKNKFKNRDKLGLNGVYIKSALLVFN